MRMLLRVGQPEQGAFARLEPGHRALQVRAPDHDVSDAFVPRRHQGAIWFWQSDRLEMRAAVAVTYEIGGNAEEIRPSM